jgi:hypothetical protein
MDSHRDEINQIAASKAQRNRDSPDDSQTNANIRAFPALLQD